MFFTFFLIVEIVSNHVKHLKYWHKASYLTLPYQHHSKDGTAGPSDAEVTLRESIKNWLFKMHVKNTNLPYTNKKTNSKLKLENAMKKNLVTSLREKPAEPQPSDNVVSCQLDNLSYTVCNH